jgi:hypothetical protein
MNSSTRNTRTDRTFAHLRGHRRGHTGLWREPQPVKQEPARAFAERLDCGAFTAAFASRAEDGEQSVTAFHG